MNEGWQKTEPGVYCRVDGKIDAFVRQNGELWINAVYFEGVLVDTGEWDSRSTAFRNAVRAMRHARELRRPCGVATEFEQRNEDDDD